MLAFLADRQLATLPSPCICSNIPADTHRVGEWTEARVVTFIVTLAAHQSVTLAARCAGLSRKSAYALNARDPAFAAAWDAAIAAADVVRRQGNKMEEVEDPRDSLSQGDGFSPRRAVRPDIFARDRFFAELVKRRGDSGPLAGTATAQ